MPPGITRSEGERTVLPVLRKAAFHYVYLLAIFLINAIESSGLKAMDRSRANICLYLSSSPGFSR
jgi:hypothetical protein